MLTCKLCGTRLNRKKIRKDGSLLCPVCGQVYWRIAIEAAMAGSVEKRKPALSRI